MFCKVIGRQGWELVVNDDCGNISGQVADATTNGHCCTSP